jgi:hypothetical protein
MCVEVLGEELNFVFVELLLLFLLGGDARGRFFCLLDHLVSEGVNCLFALCDCLGELCDLFGELLETFVTVGYKLFDAFVLFLEVVDDVLLFSKFLVELLLFLLVEVL